MPNLYNPFALDLARLAVKAAVPVLEFYDRNHHTQTKEDGSPVTEADLASDRLICAGLTANWPAIPVISEERYTATFQSYRRFFLVDPLDGTREFINRTGEFTINIALIEDGRPVAGAIYAPIRKTLFFAGEHAFELSDIDTNTIIMEREYPRIFTRQANANHLLALASLSHGDPRTDKFLNQIRPQEIRRSGSSFKFCMIAKGEADIYPRFGRTMSWDTAAGHAIIRAAGGAFVNEHGDEFYYSSGTLENGPFLAVGDPRLLSDMTKKFIEAV